MSIAAFPLAAPTAASLGFAARARRVAGPGGFLVPDGADAVPAGIEAAARPAAVGLHGLLAMQEADTGAVQDRAARRHAGSMLAEMSALQRALLQGDGAALSGAVARLAERVRHAPAAADPRLAAVVRAIAQRAAIEAARNAMQERAAASEL